MVLVCAHVYVYSDIVHLLLVGQQGFDHFQDVGYCVITEYLDETGEQVDALILNVAQLEERLSLIIQEVVFISNELSLVRVLNYHISTDGS